MNERFVAVLVYGTGSRVYINLYSPTSGSKQKHTNI